MNSSILKEDLTNEEKLEKEEEQNENKDLKINFQSSGIIYIF